MEMGFGFARRAPGRGIVPTQLRGIALMVETRNLSEEWLLEFGYLPAVGRCEGASTAMRGATAEGVTKERAEVGAGRSRLKHEDGAFGCGGPQSEPLSINDQISRYKYFDSTVAHVWIGAIFLHNIEKMMSS